MSHFPSPLTNFFVTTMHEIIPFVHFIDHEIFRNYLFYIINLLIYVLMLFCKCQINVLLFKVTYIEIYFISGCVSSCIGYLSHNHWSINYIPHTPSQNFPANFWILYFKFYRFIIHLENINFQYSMATYVKSMTKIVQRENPSTEEYCP